MSIAFLIARREFASYFRSWIGPCLVAGMLLVDGLLYYFYNGLDKKLLSGEVLQQFFYTTSGVTMIASILLTMRVLAEERQTGSLVLLNTSPVKDRDIVIGKFLAAYAVLALATLFALVHAVLLKPLPYDDPERLVMIWESNVARNRVREGPSPGSVEDWTAQDDVFDALTGWWTAASTLRGRDGSAPVTGVQVTKGFFEVFRRTPLLGRTFTDDEYVGRPSIASGRSGGREPVLVLSHGLWQSLGADPSLVGGTVFVEGRTWRVLGVMPADFAVPDAEAGFWTPWDIREAYRGARFPDGPPRDFRFLTVVGRLKAGISRDAAANRLAVLADWAWAYVTFERRARVVAGPSADAQDTLPPPLADSPDTLPLQR